MASASWRPTLRPMGQAMLILGQVVGTSFFVEDHVGFMTCAIGESMRPTFRAEGTIVLVSSLAWHRRRLQKGDIVIAKSPTSPGQMVCKRVCGVGGDVVGGSSAHGRRFFRVPDHFVWLLGDNRNRSWDSRSYGALPEQMIKGIVVFQLWPFNSRWGFMESSAAWRERQEVEAKRQKDERRTQFELMKEAFAKKMVSDRVVRYDTVNDDEDGSVPREEETQRKHD